MYFRSSKTLFCFVLLLLFTVFPVTGWSQSNQDLAAKAHALMEQNRRLEALPLYEELAKAHPNEPDYQARLADCLLTASLQKSDPAEIKSLRARARDAAKRAVELGAKNAYILEMAKLNPDAPPGANNSPAAALLAAGEKAFAENDLTAAMGKYRQAADADPLLYEAPLFAGDMAYRLKDLQGAAKWFARAVAVNPNRETAYRYWGDALIRLGSDSGAARQKYIEAVIAEPYNRMPWQQLRSFAGAQKITLSVPEINRPAEPEIDIKKPDHINIRVDSSALDDKNNPGATFWLGYSLSRAAYRAELFKKNFPDKKNYRHTLKEESDALGVIAELIENNKVEKEKLDESLRNIIELKQAGMLDCWIVLNGADQGIAQDYDAYRKDHRQLLRDYINRFILHGS